MAVPKDYLERVYAGVLGKAIGVYLGRPFEGWTHERISAELGEIRGYVHERLGHRLIVTDDDLSGTFTFVRALEEHGLSRELTAAQIGQTWLNNIIEKRTVLWWGGLGNSTEHTAYLRLKQGIPAPRSGSMDLNGRTVAEQIGAQIFIDGWAMVCPGDAPQAAEFARRAGSVSHDGEAVYAAQVIAAMEAQAFVEPNLERLLDTALALIPDHSTIHRLIAELRQLRRREPDWRRALAWLKTHYGYDRYGGNCHVVPNHGIIHLAWLWGGEDFSQALMIANTCGWDTDCNAANVGCLLGIKNGLAGIDAAPELRGPVADRMYVCGADGGGSVTDAAREAIRLANLGRGLQGLPAELPKHGAIYHFELPGSVQRFAALADAGSAPGVTVGNVSGHSAVGRRSLKIACPEISPERPARVATDTFIPPQDLDMGAYGLTPTPAFYGFLCAQGMAHLGGYGLIASPTLYSGQTLTAGVEADAANPCALEVRLVLWHYNADDQLEHLAGPAEKLAPGERRTLTWTVPDTRGMPTAQVGLEVLSERKTSGQLYLDYLTWTGEPDVLLDHPRRGPCKAWVRAWVEAVDMFAGGWDENLRLVQNVGRGLAFYGTRAWRAYKVQVELTPHLATSAGVAVRVQGLRRYYALLLDAQGVRLVKVRDQTETVLARAPLAWRAGKGYALELAAQGTTLHATIDGDITLHAQDNELPLADGGMGLVVEDGRCGFGPLRLAPISKNNVCSRFSESIAKEYAKP